MSWVFKCLAHTNALFFMYEYFIVGKTGSKFEDVKQRYTKTSSRLHQMHNNYVLALREIDIHQRQYLDITLPKLLDYQEEVLKQHVQQL